MAPFIRLEPLSGNSLPAHERLDALRDGTRPSLASFVKDILNEGQALVRDRLFTDDSKCPPPREAKGIGNIQFYKQKLRPSDNEPVKRGLGALNANRWYCKRSTHSLTGKNPTYLELKAVLKSFRLHNQEAYMPDVIFYSKLFDWNCKALPPIEKFKNINAGVHAITHAPRAWFLWTRPRMFAVVIVTASFRAGVDPLAPDPPSLGRPTPPKSTCNADVSPLRLPEAVVPQQSPDKQKSTNTEGSAPIAAGHTVPVETAGAPKSGNVGASNLKLADKAVPVRSSTGNAETSDSKPTGDEAPMESSTAPKPRGASGKELTPAGDVVLAKSSKPVNANGSEPMPAGDVIPVESSTAAKSDNAKGKEPMPANDVVPPKTSTAAKSGDAEASGSKPPSETSTVKLAGTPISCNTKTIHAQDNAIEVCKLATPAANASSGTTSGTTSDTSSGATPVDPLTRENGFITVVVPIEAEYPSLGLDGVRFGATYGLYASVDLIRPTGNQTVEWSFAATADAGTTRTRAFLTRRLTKFPAGSKARLLGDARHMFKWVAGLKIAGARTSEEDSGFE